MKTPLFTVVMPVYNAAATIADSIASVFAQSDRDFELLIIDDGSTDGTLEVAAEITKRDPRCRVISQANRGPAVARNRGISEARGLYLAFLDADDRWAPAMLQLHRKRFADRPDLGVSFGRVRFFDPTMTTAGRTSRNHSRIFLADALGENPLCTTSNLIARRVVFDTAGDFDTELRHAEDQEWLVRVLATTDWVVAGVNRLLVDYRTSPGGLSAELGNMEAGWDRMISRARDYAPGEVEKQTGRASAFFLRYLARRALRTGCGAAEAGAYFLRALRNDGLRLIAFDPWRTALTAAGIALAGLMPVQSRSLVSR